MKVLLPFIILLLTGCVCLNPEHKQKTAPTVATDKVIQDLKDTKTELQKAGEANTAVGKSVDKALTLAERLDAILAEIEKVQNKNVVPPQ